MSVKVMGLVWDHFPEGGGDLLTALKLADHADHSGGNIWPGVASVADQTRQSERTVQRHIQNMLGTGWLEVVKKGGRGPASTTHYRMPIERIQPGALRVTNLHPSAKPPTELSTELRVTPDAVKGDIHDKKGDTAMSPEPSLKAITKNRPLAEGAKSAPPASAVSRAWKAYSEGVKARYGVEPPSNGRANGQLANIVARIGAEATVLVAGYYLSAPEPFYATRRHKLDFLVRDCEGLWMDLQKRSGGKKMEPAPTKAEVRFEYEDGGHRTLQDYPIGQPLDIARKCKQDYGRMVANTHPKIIAVQVGGEVHRYSIAELDQGRTA